MRRTESVTQLLPELYLHGLSQGDFELALRGACWATVRLCRPRPSLVCGPNGRKSSRPGRNGAWADGIYVKAGLEKDKAALLVVLGAMSDGRKQVLSVRPGHRESTESLPARSRSIRPTCCPTAGNTGSSGMRYMSANLADKPKAGGKKG